MFVCINFSSFKTLLTTLGSVLLLSTASSPLLSIKTHQEDDSSKRSAAGGGGAPRMPVRAFANQDELDQWVGIKASKYYAEVNKNFRLLDRIGGVSLKLNSPHWGWVMDASTQAPGGGAAIGLKPTSPLSPSEALLDLIEKGGVIECAIAQNLVLTRIALDLLGHDTFNRNAREFVSRLPRIGGPPLLECVRENDMPRNPGEIGYIVNVRQYLQLHPAGPASGENVVIAASAEGTVECAGFGPFFSQPRRIEDVLEDLYQETARPLLTPDQLKPLPIRQERYGTYCTEYATNRVQRTSELFQNRQIWGRGRDAYQQSCNADVYKIDLKKLNELTRRAGGLAARKAEV